STGGSGTAIWALVSARVISIAATTSARATTPKKMSLTQNSETSTRATRLTPTVIAALRSRPARPTSFGPSDVKKLSLFELERLVDLVDVLLREPIEALLRAGVVVLADLGVLLGLVEGLLGAATHGAHRD